MKAKPTLLLMPPSLCVVCLALCVAGGIALVVQASDGLSVTGLSRGFSWGLYTAQFSFMAGVAGGASMVVSPVKWREHGSLSLRLILPLAELMAAVSVLISLCFFIMDHGVPQRLFFVLRNPSVTSPVFWAPLLLVLYGVLNVILAISRLRGKRLFLAVPRWTTVFRWVSIILALAVLTVTGFLYGALPGHIVWLSALTVPSFLASAFCTGPAVLLLALLAADARKAFSLNAEVVHRLSTIISFALCLYIFFRLCELFGAFYSADAQRMAVFQLLYLGAKAGPGWLSMGMWLSTVTALLSCFLLFFPSTQRNYGLLIYSLAMVLVSIWLDKCVGFMAAGFAADAFGRVQSYAPTFYEYVIVLCGYAFGALLLAVAWGMALRIKKTAQE